MIIGAGLNQLPAIQMAKAKGYSVVVTDFDPDAVGFKLADEHAIVSTRDIDATVSFAREFHKSKPIAGVMTMASESAITVAKVAEALGLPGVAPEAAFRATHKITRQEYFGKEGIPSPKFARASDEKTAISEANAIGWPVVLKPSDSAGSRGVQLVKEEQHLSEAIREIRSISKDSHFLIEEFLEGTEHSIEGIVIEGEVYWTAFSDRNYDKKHLYFPFFMEDGDTLPTAIPDDLKKRTEEVAAEAVKSLGIEFGPVKGDILIDSTGPKIIEMAARLSGDYFCYETAPLHNGINLLELVMEQSLGHQIDLSELQPKFNRGVALRYIWPRPGVITAINGVEELRNRSYVRFFKWEPKWQNNIGVGSRIVKARSMGERLGSVLVSAESRDEAVKLAEDCIRSITIKTE